MGVFGVLVDAAIFRVMRNTGDLTPMIGSLGLSLVIQYSVQAIWGPQFLRYHYRSEGYRSSARASPRRRSASLPPPWRCSASTPC